MSEANKIRNASGDGGGRAHAVTREGLSPLAQPGREAVPGSAAVADHAPNGHAPRTGGGKREEPMVPRAEFESYYGRPILNKPTWRAPNIAGYLFLGGLAGAGGTIAAAAQAGGRPGLARVMKTGSAAATGLSLAVLIHDLGRPARFINMLRMFKPTSPMSVGSWILVGFAPLTAAAAASELTGVLRPVGAAAAYGAGALGPGLATYTAALVSDTAVPAWHEGHREMPFVFASSATAAACGLGLLAAAADESEPVRRLGAIAGMAEVGWSKLMQERMGLVAECYREGRAGRLMKAAEVLTTAGVVGAALGRRSALMRRVSGAALIAGSALTRFGVFEAGVASAEDPKYTVVPQRERLARASATERTTPPGSGNAVR
ncbi:polysulfide reductase NrfD [Actinocrinis puniceicyclus]|uniref:Polysulfide reductase NrfD n=1 Tax=Actinocrinis puniceicyclus TaxID=977794 RepID=A0A8J8BGE8_9ACTN|nr:NrfD/PsrC family molybdoenzyme membrane anchor subunit [Actinocrinis puniceicyclus]MBS2965694.1 polysulfide reductase NrfD [Actinocrinis puniceicyclus]